MGRIENGRVREGERGDWVVLGWENARLFRLGLSWSCPPGCAPPLPPPGRQGDIPYTSLGEHRTPSTGTAHYRESVGGVTCRWGQQ